MKQSVVTYCSLILFVLCQLLGQSQDFENSQSHQNYLQSPAEIKKFDKNQWEIIKRSIVDGVAEENYTISESGEGGDPFLTDEDNPYKQSRQSYNEHLRSKEGYKPERVTEDERGNENSREGSRSFSIPGGFGMILALIVIPLFAFLVYMLFFKSPMAPKSKSIEEELESRKPTEIPKTELELLLEKAAKDKDYREAIRVYFIFILRGLMEKEWIEWEKEKTNASYLYEMRGKTLYSEFEATVSVYEIVWYGQRTPTEKEFEILEPRFKNLVKKLQN